MDSRLDFSLPEAKTRFIAGNRRSFFPGAALGRRRRGGKSDQMQFPSIQQFPLHFIARIEADGGGQGQRKTDVKPGLLALRTDRLNFQRIGGLHFFARFARFRFHS